MRVDFILPDIGEGIVECELVEWRVNEGDQITEDQAVADVMTDKALVEIPSMHHGKVVEFYYKQGEIAKVHQPLFAIEVEEDAANEAQQADTNEPSATVTENTQASVKASESATAEVSRPGKAVASPAVRRLAREMDIDIASVEGSGKDGRVMKEDLQAFSQSATTQPAAPITNQVAMTSENRTVPIKGVQAAMARQMQTSVATIPHFTYCDELVMDTLIDLRKRMKPGFEADGIKLTLLPFFMKAMAMAIQKFPVLNSRVNGDCTELTYLGDVNLGLAMDSPMGLLVPNVKQVQNKSIREIAAEVMRLTEAARAGRVAQEDLKGGTISLSNIGAIGGTVATPIINHPEVAIVALGRTQALPRFDANGTVVSSSIMQVSWSADHRVVDGATMSRFANLWKALLEDPVLMLGELR